MQNSMRPFLASAAERCWPSATRAVYERGGLTIDDMIADPAVASAVFEFLSRAGPNELRGLRALLRDDRRSLEAMPLSMWRDLVHLAFFDAVVDQASTRCLLGQFSTVVELITRAINPPQIRLRQEQDIARLLTDFTTSVGIAEEITVLTYSECEHDVGATSPSFRVMESVVTIGPSIGAVSEMLGVLIGNHRYPKLAAHLLKAAFKNAHWPTWRSLEWLGNEQPDLVAEVAKNVISRPRFFSAGARRHALAIRAGYRFAASRADEI